ncbi:MAG: aldehyde dehydrogenase family protein [Gammaproteobacteria bacterium]|nr:aldehyde dehydrogenase family protein [Gammaproteobacteria bacterium]
MSADTAKILEALGLEATNAGVWSPTLGWAGSGETFASMNPATGKPIAEIRGASVEEYDQVMRDAEESFRAWRELPAPERGQAVRLIGDVLRENRDALGSLVSLEMGKIKPEGDGEVQEMIDIADFALGQSRMLYGKTMHSERPGHRMYEQWHPYGVIGVATAFNFPVAVWAWNAMLSTICGNATVWKPSPKGALCAIACQKLVNKALEGQDFPPVLSFFTESGSELAQKFYADQRARLLSFTGSCHIGRMAHEIVAKRMGRVLLELGGNNAIIADETADLALAIPAIVFGAVGTAGQRCTSTRRLIAHESIVDGLVKKLVHAYKQVKIGDPLDEGVLMGPLCDENAVKRYSAAIEKAREQGGKVLCGDKVLDGPGFYVEPTIIRMPKQTEIVTEETFGPILYVLSYQDLDEAIAMQNGVTQGLSSAIFTLDLRHAERYLSATGSDCGISNVNIGTSGAEIGGAFGGEKETGGGRESGSDAWKQYMRRQTNTINWSTEMPLAQGIKFDIG